MNGIRELIIRFIVLCLGVFFGATLGFYGLYVFCYLFDYFNPPSGAGSGLVAVGWVFSIVTIPIGAIFGAIFGISFYRKFKKGA